MRPDAKPAVLLAVLRNAALLAPLAGRIYDHAPQQNAVPLGGASTSNRLRAMRITLTVQNSTALLFLSYLMQETHELAHTTVGRLICGGWGKRDFNAWELSSQCANGPPLTLLATFAGPVYSFSVIWLGYYLLTKASARVKSIGFALIVSSMPFSRILTPIFGSGDEVFGFTRLGMDRSLAWGLALVLVLALAVPPVVRIYTLVENRPKLAWVIGLLLAPFLLVGLVVFAILQGMVLKNEILDDYWIMGSPLIVTLWLFVSTAMVVIFGKHIPTLLKSAADEPIALPTESSELPGIVGGSFS